MNETSAFTQKEASTKVILAYLILTILLVLAFFAPVAVFCQTGHEGFKGAEIAAELSEDGKTIRVWPTSLPQLEFFDLCRIDVGYKPDGVYSEVDRYYLDNCHSYDTVEVAMPDVEEVEIVHFSQFHNQHGTFWRRSKKISIASLETDLENVAATGELDVLGFFEIDYNVTNGEITVGSGGAFGVVAFDALGRVVFHKKYFMGLKKVKLPLCARFATVYSSKGAKSISVYR